MIDLGGDALLDLLSEPTRKWLLEQGKRRIYGDREVIHNRGDRTPTMCLVLRGQVRLERLRRNGARSYLSTIGTGQHFGDVIMMGREKRSHTAIAVGDVEISHFDREAFNRLLARHEVLHALYVSTANRLSGSLAMSDDLRTLPRIAHLAKVLLALGHRAGPNRPIATVQEDIAALLGTTPMTIAKSLAELKRLGLIETGYRKILVPDRERLRRWLANR